jgi:hypothetical protein
VTHVLIGANEGDTTHSDASRLLLHLGPGRSKMKFGVVSFSNALFHPKVYHVIRDDGTQAAFVGSPNFTTPGLTGLNVEAGISLDTTSGDPAELLNEIAAAIDKWFTEPSMGGFSRIASEADIVALVAQGVLSEKRPPRASSGAAQSTDAPGPAQPRRPKLVVLPPWPVEEEVEEEGDGAESEGESEPEQQEPLPEGTAEAPLPVEGPEVVLPPEGADRLPAVKRPGFPDYMLFEPDATEPTSGIYALTGAHLPHNAIGVILKLKKSNSRYFRNEDGTQDVNLPISAAPTIRFGVGGKHNRPRADISLSLLFVADTVIIEGGAANSNISGYGYSSTESGHKDIRFLMPAAVKGLAAEIKVQQLPLPASGDVFVIKWPTEDTSNFELAFLARGSRSAIAAASLYASAQANGQLDGGACWLQENDLLDWNQA